LGTLTKEEGVQIHIVVKRERGRGVEPLETNGEGQGAKNPLKSFLWRMGVIGGSDEDRASVRGVQLFIERKKRSKEQEN